MSNEKIHMARANDSRTALVEATRVALATEGVHGVQLKSICEKLGITPSLVNYYFGSAEKLIAEASVVAYETYVQLNKEAVARVGKDPETRLRAWIASQLDWTKANPGIAAVLNYGLASPTVGNVISDEFAQRVHRASTSNTLLATTLVRDFVRGEYSPERLTDADVVPGLVTDNTMVVMWMTLGVSTWAAGRHLPTRGFRLAFNENAIIDRAINQLLLLVKAASDATP